MDFNQVTIIGSGLVGVSWAIIFARSKFKVCVFDTDTTKFDSLFGNLRIKLGMLSKYNLCQEENIEEIISRVSVHTNIEESLKNSFYVQECVPEILSLKKDTFSQLDLLAHSEAIIASSSSNIPASQFTENLKFRNRCIVVHPINPPHIIPLVEIVPSPWTMNDIIKNTQDLMKKNWTKTSYIK